MDTTKHSKILEAILSTRLFCMKCSQNHAYLICMNSKIPIEEDNDEEEEEDDYEHDRRIEEELEDKWMQADIDEYNKNKDVYDNFRFASRSSASSGESPVASSPKEVDSSNK